MTTREFLISSWPVHPAAVAAAVLVMAAVAVHWSRRAIGASCDGNGVKPFGASLWPKTQALYLGLAMIVFWLALNSPVDVLASQYLFSAHMLQHLLLLLIIPALLLLAWGKSSSLSSSSSDSRSRRTTFFITEDENDGRGRGRFGLRIGTYMPVVSWLAGVGAMWFWHVPTLCDAATTNPTMRGIQTISLVALGTLFWLPILGPVPSRRIAPLAGVLYLFTACVGCTLLGIYLTFTPVSVCSVYMHPQDPRGILTLVRNGWGITPLVDQQVGGLLMWVPACLVYLSGMLGLLGRWYTTGAEEAGILSRPAPQRTG